MPEQLPFAPGVVPKPLPISPFPPAPSNIIDADIVPGKPSPSSPSIRIDPKPITPSPTPGNTPLAPPPRVVPTSPAASNAPRFRPNTGGRIAGGYFPKVPPGAGGAVLRRFLPGVGNLLLLYDLWQLGCQTGVLGQTICPRPQSPAPGGYSNFQGAQCDAVLYTFQITCFYPSSPSTNHTSVTVYGAVNSVRLVSDSGGDWIQFNCRGIYQGGSPNTGLVSRGNYRTLMSVYAGTFSSIRIDSVTRNGGQADNCGNPTPEPIDRIPPENIINITNITNNNIVIVNFPRIIPPQPSPKRPPIIIIRPKPTPIPEDDPEPQPQPQPLINIDIDVVTPTPKPNLPAPVPVPVPVPVPAPTPSPIKPIPPVVEPDFEDCDPCALYTMRLAYEILEKLYKANAEILNIQRTLDKHGLVLENLQKHIDIELEGAEVLKSCDAIETVYSYKGKSLLGLNKHINQLEKQHQQIIRDICAIETESAIAAIPDWWQVRLGSDRPQLALLFLVEGSRTYHTLYIPHPLNTAPVTSIPIPTYQKGNWQGEIVCLDNSKFTVNAASKPEAETVVQTALSLIDPGFLEQPPRVHISERKGQAVGSGTMLPKVVMYFPTGQKNTIPQWRVNLKNLT